VLADDETRLAHDAYVENVCESGVTKRRRSLRLADHVVGSRPIGAANHDSLFEAFAPRAHGDERRADLSVAQRTQQAIRANLGSS
jgi:hypothetical protein